MTEEVKKSINDLISKVRGLYCLLITDRDGVPVLKLVNDGVPEAALRPNFIATFALAVDQGGKLGLGRTSSLVCFYGRYQVIQINRLPLILTFITNETCNTGHVFALQYQLDPIIEQLSTAVAEV